MSNKPPDGPARLPALTAAEKDLVHYLLRAIDLIGRMNPSQEPGRVPTSAYRHSAQALVAAAADINAAVERMIERGEEDLFAPTLTTAMLLLDAERRSERAVVRTRFPRP
ncbi:hypothetical protein ACWEKT_05055 [Nocardia takedensis]|uniref:hypothetical protein n=1 Tax=Nocardia takedensis TaxID=259390 RepID=UPI00059458D4|nr:hypothetical protein [Nocardia takedensis]